MGKMRKDPSKTLEHLHIIFNRSYRRGLACPTRTFVNHRLQQDLLTSVSTGKQASRFHQCLTLLHGPLRMLSVLVRVGNAAFGVYVFDVFD